MASTYTRPPVPSFKKGDFVVPVQVEQFRPKPYGCRRMTSAETDAWHADPQNQGMDDAGESKISSGTFYRELPEGTQMVVMKARCTGRHGWSTIGNCCEIKVVATNEILTVERRHLKLGQ